MVVLDRAELEVLLVIILYFSKLRLSLEKIVEESRLNKVFQNFAKGAETFPWQQPDVILRHQ